MVTAPHTGGWLSGLAWRKPPRTAGRAMAAWTAMGIIAAASLTNSYIVVALSSPFGKATGLPPDVWAVASKLGVVLGIVAFGPMAGTYLPRWSRRVFSRRWLSAGFLALNGIELLGAARDGAPLAKLGLVLAASIAPSWLWLLRLAQDQGRGITRRRGNGTAAAPGQDPTLSGVAMTVVSSVTFLGLSVLIQLYSVLLTTAKPGIATPISSVNRLLLIEGLLSLAGAAGSVFLPGEVALSERRHRRMFSEMWRTRFGVMRERRTRALAHIWGLSAFTVTLTDVYGPRYLIQIHDSVSHATLAFTISTLVGCVFALPAGLIAGKRSRMTVVVAATLSIAAFTTIWAGAHEASILLVICGASLSEIASSGISIVLPQLLAAHPDRENDARVFVGSVYRAVYGAAGVSAGLIFIHEGLGGVSVLGLLIAVILSATILRSAALRFDDSDRDASRLRRIGDFAIRPHTHGDRGLCVIMRSGGVTNHVPIGNGELVLLGSDLRELVLIRAGRGGRCTWLRRLLTGDPQQPIDENYDRGHNLFGYRPGHRVRMDLARGVSVNRRFDVLSGFRVRGTVTIVGYRVRPRLHDKPLVPDLRARAERMAAAVRSHSEVVRFGWHRRAHEAGGRTSRRLSLALGASWASALTIGVLTATPIALGVALLAGAYALTAVPVAVRRTAAQRNPGVPSTAAHRAEMCLSGLLAAGSVPTAIVAVAVIHAAGVWDFVDGVIGLTLALTVGLPAGRRTRQMVESLWRMLQIASLVWERAAVVGEITAVNLPVAGWLPEGPDQSPTVLVEVQLAVTAASFPERLIIEIQQQIASEVQAATVVVHVRRGALLLEDAVTQA